MSQHLDSILLTPEDGTSAPGWEWLRDLVPLPDGGFLAMWFDWLPRDAASAPPGYPYGFDPDGGYTLMFRRFGADGQPVGLAQPLSDDFTGHPWTSKAAVLPDGRVAIAWRTDVSGVTKVQATSLDLATGELGAVVDLAQRPHGSGNLDLVEVAALPDGRAFVVLNDGGVRGAPSLRSLIVEADGTVTNGASWTSVSDAVPLQGPNAGMIAVAHFDRDGGEVSFSTPEADPAALPEVFLREHSEPRYSLRELSLTALPNGGLLALARWKDDFIFVEHRNDYYHSDLYLHLMDAAGNWSGASLRLSDVAPDGEITALPLSDGGLLLAIPWDNYWDDDPPHIGLLRVDAAGLLVQGAPLVTPDGAYPFAVAGEDLFVGWHAWSDPADMAAFASAIALPPRGGAIARPGSGPLPPFAPPANVQATPDDDTLWGGDGADSIDGLGGNDFVTGGGRADTLIGGEGDDTLDGGANDDLVSGGEGHDVLRGGGPEDSNEPRPRGGWGNDTLQGEAGNDSLDGGLGADRLQGGPGDDTLDGGEGAEWDWSVPWGLDTLDGGDGDDWLVAFGGGNVLSGGEGNDRLTVFASGGALLDGGNGDDTLLGGLDMETLRGGEGNDSLDGDWEPDLLQGGLGDDTLLGGPGGQSDYSDNSDYFTLGRDTLDGGDGNDRLTAHAGDNRLHGGEGDDELSVHSYSPFDGGNLLDGEAGHDTLRGDRSRDTLIGGDGDDWLDGGAGPDLLEAGPGADTAYGSGGNDSIFGSNGDDRLRGGGGQDTVSGGNGDDQLFGDSGDDILRAHGGHDRLFGSDGNDRLFGATGNDCLRGEAGDDTVYGGRGNDRLFGAAGNDILHGSTGADTLRGGEGADVLLYRAFADSTPHAPDFIAEFTRGLDRIDLRFLDAVPATPEDDAFAFIGFDPFAGGAGIAQVRQSHDLALRQMRIEIDSGDEDALPDMVIMVNGTGKLSAGDVLL